MRWWCALAGSGTDLIKCYGFVGISYGPESVKPKISGSYLHIFLTEKGHLPWAGDAHGAEFLSMFRIRKYIIRTRICKPKTRILTSYFFNRERAPAVSWWIQSRIKCSGFLRPRICKPRLRIRILSLSLAEKRHLPWAGDAHSVPDQEQNFFQCSGFVNISYGHGSVNPDYGFGSDLHIF